MFENNDTDRYNAIPSCKLHGNLGWKCSIILACNYYPSNFPCQNKTNNEQYNFGRSRDASNPSKAPKYNHNLTINNGVKNCFCFKLFFKTSEKYVSCWQENNFHVIKPFLPFLYYTCHPDCTPVLGRIVKFDRIPNTEYIRFLKNDRIRIPNSAIRTKLFE